MYKVIREILQLLDRYTLAPNAIKKSLNKWPMVTTISWIKAYN